MSGDGSTSRGDSDGSGFNARGAGGAARRPARVRAAQRGARGRSGGGHRRPGDRPFARGGRRRRRLRHPGRRDPADVRPADGLGQGAPHPRPARAGRRARRVRLRARDGAARRDHGDLRPGRDQPGHRARGRQHGLGPGGGHHRAGGRGAHRHGRVPGGRHRRHHAAGDQAQLPRHRRGRHPAGDRGGVPHRLDRPARPGARRRREVRDAGAHHVHVATDDRPARLPSGDQAARQAGARGGPAARDGAPPGDPRRRRHHPRGRLGAAAQARRRLRRRGDHHADGPRRAARRPPAAPRHARHARHRAGGGRAPARGPDRRARRPVRRPRHRACCRASRRRRPWSTRTSTRPRSARTSGWTCRSSATCAR